MGECAEVLDSEVGVELIAAIDKASDFVVKEAILGDLRCGLVLNGVPVFRGTEAHVVLDVCHELLLAHGLFVEEVRLLVQNALHHHARVRSGILHAQSVNLASSFHLGVPIKKFRVRVAGDDVCVQRKPLRVGLALSFPCELLLAHF